MTKPRTPDSRPVKGRRPSPSPGIPVPPRTPAPPRRRALIIALGGGVIALLVGLAAFLLFRGRTDTPSPAPEAAAPPPAPHAPRNAAPSPVDRKKDVEAEERAAEALIAAADEFEKAHPGEPEKALARYREVYVKHPGTAAARRAEGRYHAVSEAIRSALEREFEAARRSAQELVAAGRPTEAVERLRSYVASQPKELLRRRAEIEMGEIENASRLAYNALLPRAEEHARAGRYDEAVALFQDLRKAAIPEVAGRCDAAVAELQAARRDYQAWVEVDKVDQTRRAFRDEVAVKVLDLVRARLYAEAGRELEAALRKADYAPVRAEIEAERAAVSQAALFWESYMRSLRPALGQDIWVNIADGNWVGGKLARILPDRLVQKTPEKEIETPLAQIHADQVVSAVIGRALPADAGETYVKAALFFFCDGRDDLAGFYFATAVERGTRPGPSEKVFREGFLRAAAYGRK